jgi:hypothetical protein
MPHLPDSQHPDHDPELIAAYAAGDATGADLERATALVSACTSCAELHHDLRSIAAATSALPAPVRRGDFRLTLEQAAALRPSGLRGLLATLSGPKFSFATPLGTGLAALGIVGVLVASGGLPTGGGTAGAPQAESATTAPAAPAQTVETTADGAYAAGAQPRDTLGEQASAQPSAAAAQLAPAPSDATRKAATGPADAASAETGGTTEAAPTAPTPPAATPSDPRLALGVLLVFVGAALVAARLVARRLARGP